MNSLQFVIVALLSIDIHINQALFISNLSVPRLIDTTLRAKISCSYEMGNRTLNSVKFYKDGHEFFRYSPLTPPTLNWFPMEGINVAAGSAVCNQFICYVDLERLNVNSSGSYRCEVSGDAPEFKLIDSTANMTVGVLPKFNPYISGIEQTYKYGDILVANCSTELLNPPATLVWYINNKTAPTSSLQTQLNEMNDDANGFPLYASNLQLRIHIDDPRYLTRSDVLELRCVADVLGVESARRESRARVAIRALKNAGHKQRLMGQSAAGVPLKCMPNWTPSIVALLMLLLHRLCCTSLAATTTARPPSLS